MKKIPEKEEMKAKIRNKLTMPMTVLNRFVTGKRFFRKNMGLAIRELGAILRLMNRRQKV